MSVRYPCPIKNAQLSASIYQPKPPPLSEFSYGQWRSVDRAMDCGWVRGMGRTDIIGTGLLHLNQMRSWEVTRTTQGRVSVLLSSLNIPFSFLISYSLLLPLFSPFEHPLLDLSKLHTLSVFSLGFILWFGGVPPPPPPVSPETLHHWPPLSKLMVIIHTLICIPGRTVEVISWIEPKVTIRVHTDEFCINSEAPLTIDQERGPLIGIWNNYADYGC